MKKLFIALSIMLLSVRAEETKDWNSFSPDQQQYVKNWNVNHKNQKQRILNLVNRDQQNLMAASPQSNKSVQPFKHLKPSPKNVRHHLNMDGRKRFYEIHLPKNYTNKKNWSVVLNIHGGSSNPYTQAKASAMDIVADREGFIVVYPAGTNKIPAALSWNILVHDNYAKKNNMRDVLFLRKVIDDVASKYKIDRKRIYSTGISQGGMMSYRLACEAPDLIAAIAPIASKMVNAFDACNTNRKIPILHFHGTADKAVLYGTGVGVHKNIVQDTGVNDLIDYWVKKNKLSTKITKNKTIGNAEYKQYGSINDGAIVGLWTLNGGGHTWPGGNVKKYLGETNRDINASELMWDFFKQFRGE